MSEKTMSEQAQLQHQINSLKEEIHSLTTLLKNAEEQAEELEDKLTVTEVQLEENCVSPKARRTMGLLLNEVSTLIETLRYAPTASPTPHHPMGHEITMLRVLMEDLRTEGVKPCVCF
jgi:TolA-binding protein